MSGYDFRQTTPFSAPHKHTDKDTHMSRIQKLQWSGILLETATGGWRERLGRVLEYSSMECARAPYYSTYL